MGLFSYRLPHFDMFRCALLLAVMALDYATRGVSKGSLVVPLDEERVNIKFCVKCGKSATGTYKIKIASIQL